MQDNIPFYTRHPTLFHVNCKLADKNPTKLPTFIIYSKRDGEFNMLINGPHDRSDH